MNRWAAVISSFSGKAARCSVARVRARPFSELCWSVAQFVGSIPGVRGGNPSTNASSSSRSHSLAARVSSSLLGLQVKSGAILYYYVWAHSLRAIAIASMRAPPSTTWLRHYGWCVTGSTTRAAPRRGEAIKGPGTPL